MSQSSITEHMNENSNASTLHCRVQFLDDIDPFSSVNLPEPARPPSFTFLTSTVLSNQLNSVHKLLNAPHRVNTQRGKTTRHESSHDFFLLFNRLPIVHCNYIDKMEVKQNSDPILIWIKHLMNNEKILKLLPKVINGPLFFELN